VTGTLGSTLVEARARRSWTLREAARRLGIHNAHLSQIERGVILRPSPGVLFQIAEGYALQFEELLRMAGYTGGPTSPAVAVAFRALIGMRPEVQKQAAAYMVRLSQDSTSGGGE
jgi:transcriptional regulator with XRE-family HTH domain